MFPTNMQSKSYEKSSKVQRTILSVVHILKLARKAHPWASSIIIVIQISYVIIPVVHAWITKYVFDTVASSFQSNIFTLFIYNLLPSLLVQMLLNVYLHSFSSISGFLQAELTRKISP